MKHFEYFLILKMIHLINFDSINVSFLYENNKLYKAHEFAIAFIIIKLFLSHCFFFLFINWYFFYIQMFVSVAQLNLQQVSLFLFYVLLHEKIAWKNYLLFYLFIYFTGFVCVPSVIYPFYQKALHCWTV